MESWQVGDIIYRGDVYAEFIDVFEILHLGIINSSGIILVHIQSLFTGTYNDILISSDKNEDLIFYNAIYSCDVNRVYEFIQKHKASS